MALSKTRGGKYGCATIRKGGIGRVSSLQRRRFAIRMLRCGGPAPPVLAPVLGGVRLGIAQEAFITNIDLTNGNESELLDNYWMPSISAGGKSAS